jgi:hypothetical protein
MFEVHQHPLPRSAASGILVSVRRPATVLVCVAFAAAVGLGPSGAHGARGAVERVTVFGDSQMTALGETPEARSMLAKGIDLDLRAAVCRRLVQESCPYQGSRPSTVLDEARKQEPALGTTAVVLVGYNDFEAVWADDVASVLRALTTRGVTRVLWLTLTERRADWERMNDILRSVARGWPQLEVLDWGPATDPTWFRDDDIHLTAEGAIGLARYVHSALVVRGIAATTAPPAPPRIALSVVVRGSGAVVVRGVRCRSSCTRTFPRGAVVRLVAKAPAGSDFVRWSGACLGTRTWCSVTVSKPTTVVARFRPR